MKRIIKTIFQNPGTLLALGLGMIMGALLMMTFALADESFVKAYIIDQFYGLLAGSLVIIFVVSIFVIYKNKMFQKITGSDKSSLNELATNLTELITYFAQSEAERKQTSLTSNVKDTAGVIANYIASTLIISTMLRYLFILFAAILSAAGTVILVQQVNVMEEERRQSKELNLMNYLELPEKIATVLTGPKATNITNIDLSSVGATQPINLSIMNRNITDAHRALSKDSLEAISTQMMDPEIKPLVLPILGKLSNHTNASVRLGADYSISNLHPDYFNSEPNKFGYFNQIVVPADVVENQCHIYNHVILHNAIYSGDFIELCHAQSNISLTFDESTVTLSINRFLDNVNKIVATNSVLIFQDFSGVDTSEASKSLDVCQPARHTECLPALYDKLIENIYLSNIENSVLIFAGIDDSLTNRITELMITEQQKTNTNNPHTLLPLTPVRVGKNQIIVIPKNLERLTETMDLNKTDLCRQMLPQFECKIGNLSGRKSSWGFLNNS